MTVNCMIGYDAIVPIIYVRVVLAFIDPYTTQNMVTGQVNFYSCQY